MAGAHSGLRGESHISHCLGGDSQKQELIFTYVWKPTYCACRDSNADRHPRDIHSNKASLPFTSHQKKIHFTCKLQMFECEHDEVWQLGRRRKQAGPWFFSEEICFKWGAWDSLKLRLETAPLALVEVHCTHKCLTIDVNMLSCPK